MVVKIGNVDESYRSYDIIRIWIELIKYYSITHFQVAREEVVRLNIPKGGYVLDSGPNTEQDVASISSMSSYHDSSNIIDEDLLNNDILLSEGIDNYCRYRISGLNCKTV